MYHVEKKLITCAATLVFNKAGQLKILIRVQKKVKTF
jgi:hypothetical protein